MATTPRKTRILHTLSKCENIPNPLAHYAWLRQYAQEFTNQPEKQRFCAFLEATGSPERCLILESLLETDRCVCEIEALLDKAQSTTSHHLKILEDAGLIRGWKKGKFTHYSLVRKTFDQFTVLWTQWMSKGQNWC